MDLKLLVFQMLEFEQDHAIEFLKKEFKGYYQKVKEVEEIFPQEQFYELKKKKKVKKKIRKVKKR